MVIWNEYGVAVVGITVALVNSSSSVARIVPGHPGRVAREVLELHVQLAGDGRDAVRERFLFRVADGAPVRREHVVAADAEVAACSARPRSGCSAPSENERLLGGRVARGREGGRGQDVLKVEIEHEVQRHRGWLSAPSS